MFEGQPKGLYALALANTGERFGYYTMLAIFTLFLQAKFGFTATVTSNIFAGFLALVYFLPVVGGILADKFGFGKMVTLGIVVMFIGYICLAIPAGNNALGIAAMVGSLFLIALGTGLFKGNLQVMVGNLYDDPKYAAKRDTAFSIFYMAINIGALFAPTAAEKITDWYMKSHNFIYNGDIPALAHQYLDGTLSGEAMSKFVSLASSQGAGADAASLTSFANDYINVLSESYHMGFAVACVSLVVSMLIYVLGRKTFKHADVNNNAKQDAGKDEQAVHVQELTPAETKSRVIALCLVFDILLDGVPSERPYADVLRTRLHRGYRHRTYPYGLRRMEPRADRRHGLRPFQPLPVKEGQGTPRFGRGLVCGVGGVVQQLQWHG